MRFSVSSKGVGEADGKRRLAPREIVLSRGLCRFRRVDLAKVPAAQRASALKLQMDSWSPYPEAESYIGWESGVALVWTWDAARLREIWNRPGRRPKVFPETVLHPRMEDGLRILQLVDGVEGQYWRRGGLELSRWWPVPPSAQEWLAFQREAGVPPDQQRHTVPAAGNQQWLRAPWLTDRGGGGLPAVAGHVEQLGLLLGVSLLTAATAWYGGVAFKHLQAQAESQQRLAELDKSLQPLREAREAALTDLARIRKLDGLEAYPGQLQLELIVGKLLPAEGAQLRDWEYQNGRLKLVFTAAAAAALLPQYVSALQKEGTPFRKVAGQVSNDGRLMTLEMEVSPRGG